jgi:hypothetical protein
MRIDQWMREHRAIIRRTSCTTLWGEALSEAIDVVLGAPSPTASPVSSPSQRARSGLDGGAAGDAEAADRRRSTSSSGTGSTSSGSMDSAMGDGMDAEVEAGNGNGNEFGNGKENGSGSGSETSSSVSQEAVGSTSRGPSARNDSIHMRNGSIHMRNGSPPSDRYAGAGKAWRELTHQLEERGGTFAGLAASITCPHRTRVGLKAYLHQPPQLKLPEMVAPPKGLPPNRRKRTSEGVRPNLVTCSICLEDLPINRMEACVFWGCGHYICQDCFKLLMGTEVTDGAHKCPICRRPILVNAGMWACSKDHTGRTIFFNTRTNIRTFERPPESEAHWSDEVEHDTHGKPYYFNRLTGEMAYSNPKGWGKFK